jgi:1,2-dihydroxy-3-keto-5-methylthiopentene dioxygenase
MTKLVVCPETDPAHPSLRTSDPAAIATHLKSLGVVFEQWAADAELPADADQTAVLAAFARDVDRIKAQGFGTVDVARIAGDVNDPAFLAKAAEARGKFLAEHTHADDEVRFFVEGSGVFYLRISGSVHIVVCEKGDYLSVPKDTKHWFDMGTAPRFTAIRFFAVEDGWVGNFTGDGIAAKFPTFDELAGVGAA